MACAAVLLTAGAADPAVQVEAVCADGPVGDAYRMTGMALAITVTSSDLADAEVRAAIRAEAADCPVAALMRDNVDVSLEVRVGG